VLISVLWLVGFICVFWRDLTKPYPMGGNFQHVTQTKDMPWKTDWSKPYYEIAYAPGKGSFPEAFATVADDVVQEWDKSVKSGSLQVVNFPDRSSLYVNSQLAETDKRLLAEMFWEKRWSRCFFTIFGWVKWAFGPPLGLLALSLAIAWVLKGFRLTRPVIG
jgi:hypothetical protein